MKYWVGLALVVACGCQSRTEIIVGVATDLRAKGQVDHVDLIGTQGQKTVLQQHWDLTDVPAGLFELPGSFGLYSPDGKEPKINLELDGSLAGQLLVQRQSIISLVSGQTLFLRLALVGDCGVTDGPTCAAGQTCVEGTCRDQEINPVRLPKYNKQLVDHTECDSGTTFIVSSSGVPMPSLGENCPDGYFCQEGVCLKRLPDDPPAPSPSADWTSTPDPTPAPLRALSGSETSGDIFAVGEGGAILHGMAGSDDPGWTPETSGVTSSLFGVWMPGPANVFAVGSGGIILRRHGGVWTIEPVTGLGAIERLDAIWGSAFEDVWAVGRGPSDEPVAIHRVNGVWTLGPTMTGPGGLHAVWGTAADDVWAVGSESQVQHFDGTSWTPISVEPGHDFLAVGGAAGNVFIVGRKGAIGRATLSGVTFEPGPVDAKQQPFTTDLFAFWAGAGNALYAVGDYGNILFSTGDGTWAQQASGTYAALFAVFGVQNRVYAAGRLGTILFSNGITPGMPNVDMAMPACTVDNDCGSACAGFMLTPRSCSAGVCVDQKQSPCSASLVCAADGVGCKASCSDDTDCQAASFCAPGGACQPRVAQGSACNTDTGGDCLTAGCRECADSYFCTDHVCCDKSPQQCGGCSVCSAPTGTCDFVAAGTDPHGTCTGMTAECTQTLCNGRGSCNNTGNVCGTNSCAAGTPGELTTHDCVDGVCTAVSPVPCANSSPCADATSCSGKCADDTGCPSGYYCDLNGDCALQKNQGGACNTTAVTPGHCKMAGCRECAASQCVDGYCCNSACGGSCQACDIATKEGTCSPVASGQPHGARTKCTTNVPACAGACAGVTGNAASQASCTYPTGACGTNSCTGSTATTHSCATGACSQTQNTPCATGYICSGTACAGAPCSDDTTCDVANDYYCAKSNSQCTKSQAAGTGCSYATSCKSGTCHLCAGTRTCIFGVCCAGPCGSQCQYCDGSGNCQGTASGQPIQGRTSCSTDGSSCSYCAGGPNCTNATATTVCNGPICSAQNQSSENFCGAGTCGSAVPTSCGKYACEAAGVCQTSCTSDADCATGYFCNTLQKYCGLADGKTCATGTDCQSSFCVATTAGSQVCCNTACATPVGGADECAGYDGTTGEYHAYARKCRSGICCDTGTCSATTAGNCTTGYLCKPSQGTCSSTCTCDNANDPNVVCQSADCDSAAGYHCDKTNPTAPAAVCDTKPIQ